MKCRFAYVAVALVCVLAPAVGQAKEPPTAIGPSLDYERLTPALSTAEFGKLGLYALPGSAYTPGWDDFGSVSLRDGYVARFFYRSVDGLMVGVIEDYFGNVYNQTRAWKLGIGFTRFDVTKFVLPDPTPGIDRPVAILTFFFYNRANGNVSRFWVAWLDATEHDETSGHTAR